MWTSSLDLEWNDLPVKPVFLPFVHRMVTTWRRIATSPPWLTVGQVLETARPAWRRAARPPAAADGR